MFAPGEAQATGRVILAVETLALLLLLLLVLLLLLLLALLGRGSTSGVDLGVEAGGGAVVVVVIVVVVIAVVVVVRGRVHVDVGGIIQGTSGYGRLGTTSGGTMRHGRHHPGVVAPRRGQAGRVRVRVRYPGRDDRVTGRGCSMGRLGHGRDEVIRRVPRSIFWLAPSHFGHEGGHVRVTDLVAVTIDRRVERGGDHDR